MERIAVVSDVHGDLAALRDALAAAEDGGCTRMLCAGDLVDLGPAPDETIALLGQREVPCIRGNHDRWALGRAAAPDGGAQDDVGRVLSADTTAFLRALPPRWDALVEGVRIAMRHGTHRSDMDGIYPELASESDRRRWLDEADADVLIVGHTHIPFELLAPGGRKIVNPGALLREPLHPGAATPQVFDPATGRFAPVVQADIGTFGVLELPSRRFQVYRASDGVEVSIARR